MLHERSMLATLQLSIFSPTKTDRAISQGITHDKRAKSGTLRVVKSLLPIEAIEPVRKIHDELRKYHLKHTLPWGDDNARLLNSAFYLEYQESMRRMTRDAEHLTDRFCSSYDTYVTQARQDLGSAFNDSDYPPRATIRDKFAIKLKFAPVPDAGDFRISIQRDAMNELRSNLTRQIEEAEVNARNEVWKRIAEPLVKMAERLADPEANFKDSLVGNLAAMVDLVPHLNITGDPQIEAIRQRIKAELAGKDPDVLRESPMARNATARRAAEILDQMSGFMGVAA